MTTIHGPKGPPDALQNHYILCGAGLIGLHIAREFIANHLPCVIIEQRAATLQAAQELIDHQALFIQGDATEDSTLELGSIKRATGLITTLGDDKENVFIVLSARALNPGLRIISRVSNEAANGAKLYRAGADVIVAPDAVGGMRMASEMIRPETTIFLDKMLRSEATGKKKLRLIEISADNLNIPPTDDLSLADVGKHTHLLVIAIKREGRYIYRPGGNTPLYRTTPTRQADTLVVIGLQKPLEEALTGQCPTL